MKCDEAVVDKVMISMQTLLINPFEPSTYLTRFLNVLTKGKAVTVSFFEKCLLGNETGFYEPMKDSETLDFFNNADNGKEGKTVFFYEQTKVYKQDCWLWRRGETAEHARRLSELVTVPLSIVTADGDLQKTSKAKITPVY